MQQCPLSNALLNFLCEIFPNRFQLDNCCCLRDEVVVGEACLHPSDVLVRPRDDGNIDGRGSRHRWRFASSATSQIQCRVVEGRSGGGGGAISSSVRGTDSIQDGAGVLPPVIEDVGKTVEGALSLYLHMTANHHANTETVVEQNSQKVIAAEAIIRLAVIG